MAEQRTVITVDDIDETTTEGVENVKFHDLDGRRLEIDLSPQHRADLDQALKEARAAIAGFVESARIVQVKGPKPGKPGRAPARADRAQTQAIRDWARANGHTVNDRGRISKDVVDAFNAAH